MESQLVRPNGGQQQEQEQEQEHQQQQEGHDKNSVLHKVKAKAKKLKETIARRARGREHGHEDDHHQDAPNDHDLDEEEDEDMVTVTDPNVRTALIDSPMIGEPGRVKTRREEVVPASAATIPDSGSSAVAIDRGLDQKMEDFVRAPAAKEGPKSPARTDPDQAKISDPTGLGKEDADVSPLMQSIGKMTIESELEPIAEGDPIPISTTGSFDVQFSPETVGESIPAEDESEKRASGSSYTEKIISVTAAIADKATSAKDVVASKLGITDKPNPDNAATEDEQTADQPPSRGITGAVTETLSPVYEKVVETGSAVVSKVRGSGGDMEGSSRQDKGVSVKKYVAEKLKPGEEEKALSEVISDALRERKEGMGKAAEETVGGAVGHLLGKNARPRASGCGTTEEGEDLS